MIVILRTTATSRCRSGCRWIIIKVVPFFHPFRPLTRSAVPRQYDEDLFEATKMSFGEHLEELRTALMRALVALVLGILIAFIFAQSLVDYVQTPLRGALKEYYREYETDRYEKELLASNPDMDPKDAREQAEVFADQGLVAEQRMIDREEVATALGMDAEDDTSPPPSDNKAEGIFGGRKLIPITFFKDLDDDPRISTIALGMQEPFMIWMKAAFVLGLIIASPFIFYFIWAFVAAGLYPHEKKYVHVFLPFSLGLFLLGAALAFFVVFQFVLDFLLGFYSWLGINPQPRITDWLNFVLLLPIGFGIGFQLPLVMLFLERIGVFTVATYKQHWRIAILVISILSMLLTPADYQSMLFMFGSLTMLYFGGILLCQFMPKRRTPFGDMVREG